MKQLNKYRSKRELLALAISKGYYLVNSKNHMVLRNRKGDIIVIPHGNRLSKHVTGKVLKKLKGA